MTNANDKVAALRDPLEHTVSATPRAWLRTAPASSGYLSDALHRHPIDAMPIQTIADVPAGLPSNWTTKVTGKAVPVHARFELKKREVLI